MYCAERVTSFEPFSNELNLNISLINQITRSEGSLSQERRNKNKQNISWFIDIT
jgi:hypothetical protein